MDVNDENYFDLHFYQLGLGTKQQQEATTHNCVLFHFLQFFRRLLENICTELQI